MGRAPGSKNKPKPSSEAPTPQDDTALNSAIENLIDAQTTIEAQQEQSETQSALILDLQRTVESFGSILKKNQLELEAIKQKTDNRVAMDTDIPLVTNAQIEAFLNSTRPKTEFFNRRNPFYKYCMFRQTRRKHEGMSGPGRDEYTIFPSLWLNMERWRGPGAEMADPLWNETMSSTQKVRMIGQCDLSRSNLIQLREEDIDKYDLNEDSIAILRPNAPYPIKMVLQRIQEELDYRTGSQIVSGRVFQLEMKAIYAGLRASQMAEEEMRQEVGELREGEEKILRKRREGSKGSGSRNGNEREEVPAGV